MKKVLKILLISVLCAFTAFSVIACTPENPGGSNTGLKYTKRDGVYVVNGYEGTETNVTVDIEGATKIRIKKEAFKGTSIEELTISDKVVEIDAGAFAKMSALKTLTVPFIGKCANADAFFGQTGSANESEKAVDEQRTIAHFFGTDEYAGGVTATAKVLKEGTETSTTFYIPLTLTTIEVKSTNEYAIPADAFNGFDTPIGLQVILSGNVTAIGERAFKDSGIKNIVIPASVQTIYAKAFENSKLKSVDLSAVANGSIIVKDFAFKGCNKMVKFGTSEDNTIDLAKISNLEIGEYAFDFGIEEKTFTLVNASSFNDSQLTAMFRETKFTK